MATERENIQLLLDAQTSENNHLAITLLMHLLQFDFEEAFAQLQLTPLARKDTFGIEIKDIRIVYKVQFEEMIYVPAKFADIQRTIYFRNKLEPNSTQKIHADEQSVFDLGWECDARELPQIRADLQSLAAYIEALYEYMNEV